MGNTIQVIQRFFSSFRQHSLTSIPAVVRRDAWFAFEAYSSNPPTIHDGFALKTNLPDLKVWINPASRQVLFAIRGTDENILKMRPDADYSDLATDLRLILNSEQQTTRYIRAETVVSSYLRNQAYRGYKFIVVGHSLGGSICYRLADKYHSLTGNVFNPGVNRDAIRNTASVSRRIQTHIISGDPVSGILGRALGNTIVYTPFYDPAEQERFKSLPIQQQLFKLHSMEAFPRL
jgi:hypothetical protein